eukprot:m.203347 g.203347  ORF g.203347 m.203347 type:complete len:70 (-) comp32852_c11_seq1:20-229(-)
MVGVDKAVAVVEKEIKVTSIAKCGHRSTTVRVGQRPSHPSSSKQLYQKVAIAKPTTIPPTTTQSVAYCR